MRSTRQPPLQFTFGRDPSREQRALLPQQQPLAPCALSRFNLRPATVAFGRGAAPGYACLASQHHDESGDEDEGAVLPQRNCQRCCLFLCVLALMAGGTGIVLRFLLARDSHPSSPAAKLAAAKMGLTPSHRPATKPPTAVATRPTPRVVAVPVLRRSPPPPSPQRLGSEVFLIQGYAPPPSPPPPLGYAQGDEFPESDASLRAAPPPGHPWPYLKVPPPPPPWPPWPPVGLSPHPPAARSPPPPPWPPVFSPPSPPMFATATPPDARSAELALALQTFAERNASRPPPSPLREMGALTIPAVAARVAAEARKRRAKNQTRV